MMKHRLMIGVGVMLAISLGGCSAFSTAGKTARNMTSFGGQSQRQNEATSVDEKLLIPPSLKMPSSVAAKSNPPAAPIRANANRKTVRRPIKRAAVNPHTTKNYYVVVGTYPTQEEALDTFVRLSSIGLPNSTMETRKTKSGQRLHMVRLGPFQDQAKIDKVKDSLLSDGLSQFKVVEN